MLRTVTWLQLSVCFFCFAKQPLRKIVWIITKVEALADFRSRDEKLR